MAGAYAGGKKKPVKSSTLEKRQIHGTKANKGNLRLSKIKVVSGTRT